MPTQRPDQERIEAIIGKLLQAVADGKLEPIVALEHGERTALIDLAEHDREEIQHIVARMREAARSAGWSADNVRRLNLRGSEQSAKQRLTREQQAIRDADGNVVAARRINSRKKANKPLGNGAGLTVEEMLDQDSSMTLIAIGHLQQKRAGRVWFDTFHLSLFTDWDGTHNEKLIEPRPIDDAWEINAMVWLHAQDYRLGRGGIRVVETALSFIGHQHRRNEPVDWLHDLQWDKTKRLGGLFIRGFGAADTHYHEEIARCWMVSMVARVRHPGCKVDTMPVFGGREGIAKSQALRIIGGKFHREAASSADDRNFLQEMIGAMLFEVAELHSLTGKGKMVARMKAAITNEDDYFRAPYERKPSSHRRTCVWCGTTNEEDWYSESGPGRRFWAVLCAMIELGWITEHREQLWAEAAHYERLGVEDPLGCWWNFPEDEQRAAIEHVRQEVLFESQFERYLHALTGSLYVGHAGPADPGYIAPTASIEVRRQERDGHTSKHTYWGSLITTERLAVDCLGMDAERSARGNNLRKIADAMRSLGYTNDKLKVAGTGRWVRFWVVTKRRDVSVTETTPDPDDESPNRPIPF